MNKSLVDFDKGLGHLEIRINERGRGYFRDDHSPGQPPIRTVMNLLEYQLCNGWQAISASDLGLSRSAGDELVLFDDGIGLDDMGYITYIDHFYFTIRPYEEMVSHMRDGVLTLPIRTKPFTRHIYSKGWKAGYPQGVK